MVLIISFFFSLGILTALNATALALPDWFLMLFGVMCYTFVLFFADIVRNVILLKKTRKYYRAQMPMGTYQPGKSTLDVQQEIETYAAELRQTSMLAGNSANGVMYKDFETLFTDFSNKLKDANEKHTGHGK